MLFRMCVTMLIHRRCWKVAWKFRCDDVNAIYITESIAITTSNTHYSNVIMGAMASQVTSLTIVYSTVYSGSDQRKYHSASLAFVRGIHRWPVNSPHKNVSYIDDVIMKQKVTPHIYKTECRGTYNSDNAILKSISSHKNLWACQHRNQLIRNHIRKSVLTNMNLNMDFYQ